MMFLIGYVTCLAVFGILDAVWLSIMANALYRPALGDVMLDRLRLVPAAIFYLGFPLGVMHFAVMPAVRAESLAMAFGNGALIGLIAYATYDLTNYATLRPWTLQITLADIAYGTVAIAVVAAAACWTVRSAANWGLG
jgi:uncharacterized membrane protein